MPRMHQLHWACASMLGILPFGQFVLFPGTRPIVLVIRDYTEGGYSAGGLLHFGGLCHLVFWRHHGQAFYDVMVVMASCLRDSKISRCSRKCEMKCGAVGGLIPNLRTYLAILCSRAFWQQRLPASTQCWLCESTSY